MVLTRYSISLSVYKHCKVSSLDVMHLCVCVCALMSVVMWAERCEYVFDVSHLCVCVCVCVCVCAPEPCLFLVCDVCVRTCALQDYHVCERVCVCTQLHESTPMRDKILYSSVTHTQTHTH